MIPNPYESPQTLDIAAPASEPHVAAFPRWIQRLFVAAALLHGLLGALLLWGAIRGILIVTGVMRDDIGKDPRVWIGINLIMVTTWCASLAAWHSRKKFAVTLLRITAICMGLIVVAGFFLVPLSEAWVGPVNATIATGATWTVCGIAWLTQRRWQ